MVVPCCHVFGKGRGFIWLDNLNCQGSEPDVSLCPHSGWGVTSCSHDKDVGVICKSRQIDRTGEDSQYFSGHSQEKKHCNRCHAKHSDQLLTLWFPYQFT